MMFASEHLWLSEEGYLFLDQGADSPLACGHIEGWTTYPLGDEPEWFSWECDQLSRLWNEHVADSIAERMMQL